MTKSKKDDVLVVVVIKVGGKREVRAIPNTLAALQAIVGGYIEPVRMPLKDVVLYANEEGLLKNLPYNCTIGGTHLVGDLVVTANTRSGETRSLTLSEQNAVMAFFNREG